MPVQQKADRVILQHPKGASAEILLYGASVVSWRSGSKIEPEFIQERLFVSSKAYLDGSKPVRGGIPVVFPCFGPPSHPQHSKLSQHGFARNTVWSFDSVVMDNDDRVSVRFTLEPTPDIKAIYDHSFHLGYLVTLAQHQLSTDLHVKNTSSAPSDVIEFQALFHNYIRAPSKSVLIYPLAGKSYYDKTESTNEGRQMPKTEVRNGVDVLKFTDSVYEDAGQQYEIKWPGGCVDVRTVSLKDLVVWNPQADAGKKMADMEDDGWERFVCVEPGYVRGFMKLEGGATWIGQQVLTVTGETKQML